MLYFLEYDGMRYLLGRQRSGEQGPIPAGIPIPVSLAPFVCGSFAGVSTSIPMPPTLKLESICLDRLLPGPLYIPSTCNNLRLISSGCIVLTGIFI